MLNDIILICLLLLAFGYWFVEQKAKEIALKATKAHCLAMDVQMLDDYVALRSRLLKRDKSGLVCWERLFEFEFSSIGDKRYTGTLLMLCCRVESIYMAPYRIQ
jgi:hypothetical protein